MKNEPQILGFLCHWCCYAAADAAGVGRLQYPPHIRSIRVMCTGRIEPAFLLPALPTALTAYSQAADILVNAITGPVIMKP